MMKRCRASLLAGAVGVLSLLCTGCHPTGAWLPDSSGIVYSDFDEQPNTYVVIHYDLKSKKKTTLVKGLKGSNSSIEFLSLPAMPVPAVSPDGKQIALAEITSKRQEPTELQITLYDFTGKVVKQSKLLPLSTGNVPEAPATKLTASFLYWFPDGKHILVVVPGLHGGHQRSAIYDIDKDEAKLVDFTPLTELPFVRPDGKGLVGGFGKPGDTKGGEKSSILLMDWDGKLTPVDASFNPIVIDPVGIRWGKGKLLFEGPGRLAEIDLQTGKVEMKAQKFDVAIAADEKILLLPFGDGVTRLGLVSREPKSAAIPSPVKLTDVVVYGAGGKKTVVVEGETTFPLMPTFSPDGTMALIRLENRMLVIKNNGTIVAEIETAKKKP